MSNSVSKKQPFRSLVVRTLREIRARPWIHRPVHALAVRLLRYRFVARFIQSVLEPQYLTTEQYVLWIEQYDSLTDADREAIRAQIETFAYRPLISVVMPAYDTDPKFLREAIASVRGQLYPHWELCVADDASPSPKVWEILTAEAAADPRIKVMRREQNGHISAASNSALTLAAGEFVALMDHDDRLTEHALYEVVADLQAHPEADLIYSDEDKIDEKGRRFEPYFKTGWNPELMLGQNAVSHLGVYRRALLTKIGGFREGFEGSQDYDLALRFSEQTTAARIRHIPTVLYHWRQQTGRGASFSEAFIAQCAATANRAVREHLERTGAVGARIEQHKDSPAWLSVRRAAPTPAPMVSIIVPTRDRPELLERCVRGVLDGTDYPNFELLVVDNDSVEPATKTLFTDLAKDPRVRILPAPGPFNYSKINNDAVRRARGEILLLLNNDVAVIEPHWLTEMVGHAVRPEVGAVGARLLYADGRVQHGGVILGVGYPPVAGNLYAGAPAEDRGYYSHLRLARNMSAVTAACLAVRKSVFAEVGGFDEEHLAVAFNDVDLCLKIRERGYQIIWTPHAELHHLESATRGSDLRPEVSDRITAECNHMLSRWGQELANDPYYGPNFDSGHGDYRLSSPPRRVRPWLRDKV